MASSKAPGGAVAAVAFSAFLALAGLVIDVDALSWILGLTILVALIYAMAISPLRYSLLGLMAMNLMLECPTDRPAAGMWESFLYPVGALMLTHMNQHTTVRWLSFSGSDLLLGALILITIYRRLTRSSIDRKGRIPSPAPMRRLAFVSLAGTAVIWLWGLARGGDFSKSLWQVEKVFYLPVVFLLFDDALRRPKDFIAVGRILIIAACYKALTAVYVMNFVSFPGDPPSYATSHHDSLLFATATVVLLSLVVHRARKNALRLALSLAPILVAGMMFNNRRMVWVQIALVLLTLYFAMPMTPVKKKIRRTLIRLSPLALIYVAVGWSMPSGIFKPIATLQSVTRPATDVSTMTRDIENYDITMTIKDHPIMGLGWGHGYYQIIPLPPMPHPLEPWLPHNSLLGLWFASGVVGYTAMTLLWTAGVYFGVRAYRAASRPIDRATLLPCFGSVLMYMIQCYGDVGLGSWTAVFTVAPALAVSGKLAVMSGAWPVGRPKTAIHDDAGSTSPSEQNPGHARSG